MQFSKNFPLPKNGGHLTVRDRAISSKFSTQGVSKKCTLCTYGGHFEFFEFLPKMEKHKLALTVQNRVISLKFSTHRVSKKCTLGNFQKNFLFPKMAAILNFQIFAKNRKTVFLTMQDRVISSKFSTQPMQKGMKLK